jgi:hypothetical protein
MMPASFVWRSVIRSGAVPEIDGHKGRGHSYAIALRNREPQAALRGDNQSAFFTRLRFSAKSAMAEILVPNWCDPPNPPAPLADRHSGGARQKKRKSRFPVNPL